MIDVDDVPTGAVTLRRAEAEKKLLRELAASSASQPVRHRRRVFVLGALAAVGLAGVSAAAAYTVLAPERATQRDSARCYTEVSGDTGDDFPGTTIAEAQKVGGPKPDVPPAAVRVCADLWRQGFLTEAGATEPPDGEPRSDRPVPELVACVLPSGQTAVFPGDAQTCSNLGFPILGEG